MKSSDGILTALGLVAMLVTLVMFIFIVVVGIGDWVKAPPPPKSKQQLCEERGGVYVTPYRSSPMCLAPNAFR